MKQTHQSVSLAGLLAVALAMSGCTSMHGGESSKGAGGAAIDRGSEYPARPSGGVGMSGSAGATGSQGMPEMQGMHDGAGSMGSTGASMQDDRGDSAARTGARAASAAPNSTVLAIEILPASSGITEGDASMGTSGTAGAMGSSPSGPSYRVTVRMDDGSTQVVTHASTPDFRSGDRINVTGGAIVR